MVGFLEVVAGPATGDPEAEPAPAAGAPESGTIAAGTTSPACATVEIGLAGGRLLRVPVGLPTAELQRLIGAVEGA